MKNPEEFFRIDIEERMNEQGASGMLLSLNMPDIMERDMKSFYINGGMVICLCRKYDDLSDKFFHLLAVYYKENRTVQEISDRLNFSSPSAFVQFFKKHTGTTPKKSSPI